MKTVSVPLLQLARTSGLVRGIRMIRIRTDHGMAWAVALRILGCWWLVARPRAGRIVGHVDKGGSMTAPLVLASTGDARNFLDDMRL